DTEQTDTFPHGPSRTNKGAGQFRSIPCLSYLSSTGRRTIPRTPPFLQQVSTRANHAGAFCSSRLLDCTYCRVRPCHRAIRRGNLLSAAMPTVRAGHAVKPGQSTAFIATAQATGNIEYLNWPRDWFVISWVGWMIVWFLHGTSMIQQIPIHPAILRHRLRL